MTPTIRRISIPLVGLILMGLSMIAPAGASLTCTGLVGYPNYSCPWNLTYTLGPLLDGITALVPSIVNLLVSLLPLILIGIAIAIVISLGRSLEEMFREILSGISGYRGRK
jgi:hypothetical protein